MDPAGSEMEDDPPEWSAGQLVMQMLAEYDEATAVTAAYLALTMLLVYYARSRADLIDRAERIAENVENDALFWWDLPTEAITH
jgi:hypothetical protein